MALKKHHEQDRGRVIKMDLKDKHCVPCKGGTLPLGDNEESRLAKEIPSWDLLRDGKHRLAKQFNFPFFEEGIAFVDKIALMAEEEGHHPDICIRYRKVHVELTTHAMGGLSENDFVMAAKIDDILTKTKSMVEAVA